MQFGVYRFFEKFDWSDKQLFGQIKVEKMFKLLPCLLSMFIAFLITIIAICHYLPQFAYYR